MTTQEARNLRPGQRVYWTSSGERGTVTRVGSGTVTITWDDDDCDHDYPVHEQWHGIAHVAALNDQKGE